MKTHSIFLLIALVLTSCAAKIRSSTSKQATTKMAGTWKLIIGMVIEKGDTTLTDYTKNTSFIKIINNTHFAFMQHDLSKGKDTTAVFVAGGGKYSLSDSLYTEHLEYCNDRNWENNDFSFIISIKNDTLVQRGVEKVESAGVNRVNMEKYVRLR